MAATDVYNVNISDSNYPSTTPINDNWWWYQKPLDTTPVTNVSNWTVSYPTYIYMYQIKCPKCKTMNWLKLDTITPCTKCEAKLKAVSEQAEYEIAVT